MSAKQKKGSPTATGAARPKAKAKSAMKLRLYIAGDAPNSLRAQGSAKAICEAHFPGGYELEVVDMIASPDRAIADGIIVTPTLVRLHPSPLLRVIGNLSDTDRVLMILVGS